MRFRVLFVLFNAVILVSFALILFMPAFVLGWEYTRIFWGSNWPVGLVFLIVLAALNAYFVYNWRVFSLLEQEDWKSLVDYLEKEILEKKRVGSQRLRILINAYVVTGAIDRIGALEGFLRERRAKLVGKLAVELGLPHLLSNDADRMLAYFGEMKERSDAGSPVWIRWCYAFALMSATRFDEAKAELVSVLEEARDPLLRALCAHMLEPFGSGDEAIASRVGAARAELRSRYTRDRMNRELERQRQNLQVLFLATRIEEARDWVFAS